MSSPDTLNQILDLVRLAWPGQVWQSGHADESHYLVRIVHDPDPQIADALLPNSLDDLARVLRAMPGEVRDRFDKDVCTPFDPDDAVCNPSWLLAKDPLTLWPLLHRAAFPDGVVNE